MVKYYSTRGHKEGITFDDIILSGLAPDNGLYLPDSTTIESLTYLTQENLSYEDFVKTIFISLDKASAKYLDNLSIYQSIISMCFCNHASFILALISSVGHSIIFLLHA